MKKISLILFIIGILIILFIANTSTLKEGTIEEISTSEGLTKIKLYSQNETLIVFQNIKNVNMGDTIKFNGKSQEYNGQEQIILQKIILVKK